MAQRQDPFPVSATDSRSEPKQRPRKEEGEGMKRVSSLQQLQNLAVGPTQHMSLGSKTAKAPPERPLAVVWLLVAVIAASVCASIVVVYDTAAGELPTLALDVITLKRAPATAQDNAAAALSMVLFLAVLTLVDHVVCMRVCTDSGARWFLLHALGNLVVAAMCLPDIFYAFRNPPYAVSKAYCLDLPFPGCSDLPTTLIIAMHLYHMIAFRLGSDDLFHHLTFVPIIGGINFIYPWGVCSNILCFFISGLPGGLDYLMLSAVKAGMMKPYTEKRINCSINTWIRGPGITMFCTLCVACWMKPPEGTPPEDLMPWYFFAPGVLCAFFNGQYYAQRVIGNYYIRKAQDYQKRGIQSVDLHTS